MHIFSFLLVAIVAFSSAYASRTKAGGFTYLGTQTSKLARGNSQTDFHLSAEKKSWEDAFNICQDELGGRLLSLESKAKEAVIKEYLTGYTIDYIWTSGVYDQDEASWYWLTSLHLLEYTNWKSGVTPNTGSSFRLAYYKALKPNWQSLPKSNLNRFICELDPIAEPCFEQKDLVVVLDGSGSITAESFVKAQEFVAKLARAFTVYDPTKIGFIVYSNDAVVHIPLKNVLSPGQIETEIVTAIQPQQLTNTSGGIDTAVAQLRGSDSVGIPKIMVVLTDGYSNNGTATFASAVAATGAGVTSFGVGIGYYSTVELLAIANNDASRVYTTDTFDNLIHLLAPLGHKICDTRK